MGEVKESSVSARAYPLPPPENDPRFTMGLTLAVVSEIESRGYPKLQGRDIVDLQQSLFRFLYVKREAP